MVLLVNADGADQHGDSVPRWAAAVVIADALNDLIAEADERLDDGAPPSLRDADGSTH